MATCKKSISISLIALFLSFCNTVIGQVLNPARSVNWQIAGVRDTTTSGFETIDLTTFGAVGDSLTPNDSVLSNALSSITGPGAIITFGNGNFRFNQTITLPSNVILKGVGAGNTKLTMDLGGSGHSIDLTGSISNTDTAFVTADALRDSNTLIINNSQFLAPGDWIQIHQTDTQWVTSSWAESTVGQIVQIASIDQHKLTLNSPLRLAYSLTNKPHIHKITPVYNIGIECLTIERIDSTAPEQSSNIHFKHATNCWVIGLESHNCTFSHIEIDASSNILIAHNYFHDAFHYGENGRAYGVIINGTGNECCVQDNIFKHLRHSMILQSGANGNVFAYNYSIEPFWETSSPLLPNNSAGDMVLHGNFPYCNLFEGNIGQNIVIDDSHGANGPFNTFFRNSAESFGIFFSATSSPDQNLIGNEIPNNTYPYNLINYTIQGTGHFLYGNNDKGTITPVGTETLSDISYKFPSKPSFITQNQWGSIGTPNTMGTGSNPAKTRYLSNTLFTNSCGNTTIQINKPEFADLLLFPNPTTSVFHITNSNSLDEVILYNAYGQILNVYHEESPRFTINLSTYPSGLYYLSIFNKNNGQIKRKVIKID